MGRFIFGVKTTGIFCVPSCRAGTPNVRMWCFLIRGTRPKESGFRACLRCKPKSIGEADPQIEKMVKICGLLESEDLYSLDDLAATTWA